ncbi:MAG: sulfotransferase domain-containing protein [Deltaproteobacteria bacterium]|nr:sulfotransferase domain-containing protein [Deltaproteobacteria bacterium]
MTEWRQATARWRVTPKVICIGGMRCGTTTFFRMIRQHPDFVRAEKKEIHYFDRTEDPTDLGYRASFPTSLALRLRSPRAFTADVTPKYLVNPNVAERIRKVLGPDVRMLVLLRNPVARAISHYYKRIRVGLDTLSIEESFAAALANQNPNPTDYLPRGHFAEQISLYIDTFSREQLLIRFSADFFSDAQRTLDEVADHFGIARWTPQPGTRSKAHKYEAPSPALVEKLEAYFEPHDAALSELLGTELPWRRSQGPE